MSYYNSETNKIVIFQPRECDDCPGWMIVDCGCCMGQRWTYGGECKRCGGTGVLFLHKASGTYAMYPGGPLRGRECKHETNNSN